MPRLIVKCPKCEYQESVLSSRPGADLPPCPRCEEFVRMDDITPAPGDNKTTWSTAGSQRTVDESTPTQSPTAVPIPKRRDMRDLGPEPRN